VRAWPSENGGGRPGAQPPRWPPSRSAWARRRRSSGARSPSPLLVYRSVQRRSGAATTASAPLGARDLRGATPGAREAGPSSSQALYAQPLLSRADPEVGGRKGCVPVRPRERGARAGAPARSPTKQQRVAARHLRTCAPVHHEPTCHLERRLAARARCRAWSMREGQSCLLGAIPALALGPGPWAVRPSVLPHRHWLHRGFPITGLPFQAHVARRCRHQVWASYHPCR